MSHVTPSDAPPPPRGDDGPWPVATTRALAVLGWPVGHSLSPAMHNAALRADGLDLVYLALPVPPPRLSDVVRALGEIAFLGANVTVPHKRAVMARCDTLTDEARVVGAVNTLTWHDGMLEGHNTDAVGLERALDEVDAGRRTAVVLGTGGSARAAVVALLRRGADVTVVGRRPAAAAEVAAVGRAAVGPAVVGPAAVGRDAMGGATVGRSTADDPDVRVTSLGLDAADVATAVAAADVVVNATPLGMGAEDLPAPFMALASGQTAYDLVYAPPDTPFLRAADRAGANAHHGLSMLVHQAAAAYERWTGRPAPVDVMRDAAVRALADR